MKRFGMGLVALACLAAGPALAAMERVDILAPAGPGGGWDQTARAMQAALETSGIVGDVEVTNISGAGGTVGLAQFVSASEGDGSQMIVGGLVMVGAILTNNSPVTLDQVTPLARLTGEYEVIVVPAASAIGTMGDLVAQMKDDPGAVAFAGGSAGGTDHILVGLVAKAAGIDPSGVNYIPFSGGGEALAALLSNDVAAGVSGLGEFLGQIQAGELRALAISGPERLPGLDIPTLKEAGIDIELVNWRAVMAAPGLDDAEKAALAEAIDAMVKSEAWQTTLKDRGWMDLYLPPAEFAAFLAEDRAKVEQTLKDIGLVQP
jgi:putative tricarboxylic transport membrane protein